MTVPDNHWRRPQKTRLNQHAHGFATVDTISVPDNVTSNIGTDRIVVEIEAGTATITDNPSGTSHVNIACNNGLVIDADWERNEPNKFGYDIYEPEVNMDYNRLAVMVLARGVIAEYLNGGYD